MKNSCTGEVLVHQIAMVGVDVQISTEEHCPKFGKRECNTQELFFKGVAVLLCLRKLAGVAGHRSSILHDASADLTVGSISAPQAHPKQPKPSSL